MTGTGFTPTWSEPWIRNNMGQWPSLPWASGSEAPWPLRHERLMRRALALSQQPWVSGPQQRMETQADPELSKGTKKPREFSGGGSARRSCTEREVRGLQTVPLSTQPGTTEHACLMKLTEAGWDEIVPNTHTSWLEPSCWVECTRGPFLRSGEQSAVDGELLSSCPTALKARPENI